MTKTNLRVLAFDGAFNLPLWVGQDLGIFERHGLKLQLDFTPNSAFLVTSLMDGTADIALAGFDNIVAYQEGQGEAALASQEPDLFAFMGGDRGFLSLVADGKVHALENLRDQLLAVDALTTGFAFALRAMLAMHGLSDDEVRYTKAGGTASRFRALMAGEHCATLLRTPYELMAGQAGFRTLARVDDVLGAYMGTVGAARRQWARDNDEALVRFLRAYAQSMGWLEDPAHRERAMELLQHHTPGLDVELAAQAYDRLLDERTGLIRDLRPDAEGINTVLRLRSKFGLPQRQLSEPMRYVDTSYLRRAL